MGLDPKKIAQGAIKGAGGLGNPWTDFTKNLKEGFAGKKAASGSMKNAPPNAAKSASAKKMSSPKSKGDNKTRSASYEIDGKERTFTYTGDKKPTGKQVLASYKKEQAAKKKKKSS